MNKFGKIFLSVTLSLSLIALPVFGTELVDIEETTAEVTEGASDAQEDAAEAQEDAAETDEIMESVLSIIASTIVKSEGEVGDYEKKVEEKLQELKALSEEELNKVIEGLDKDVLGKVLEESLSKFFESLTEEDINKALETLKEEFKNFGDDIVAQKELSASESEEALEELKNGMLSLIAATLLKTEGVVDDYEKKFDEKLQELKSLSDEELNKIVDEMDKNAFDQIVQESLSGLLD